MTPRPSKPIRYYNIPRHWTKRIEPHLDDAELNEILVRDFNRFTYGRWRQVFLPGRFPAEFESCDWRFDHRSPEPRYWYYFKHSACHWLVNFALRLATLAEPKRPWRILTSDQHSTVWDGRRTLFDLNSLALGVAPQDTFDRAYEEELPVGEQLEVHFAHPRARRRSSAGKPNRE
jgi:hypothetical protein